MLRADFPRVVGALAVVLLAAPLAWCQCTTNSASNAVPQHSAIQETIVVSESNPNVQNNAPSQAIVSTGDSVSRPDELAILTLNVNHPTTVQSKVVNPGVYMMVVNGDSMTLQDLHTNKVIAQSPVSWTLSDRTFNNTRLDVDQNDMLTKIDIGGTNQAIVLQNPASSTAPNASSSSAVSSAAPNVG